MFLFILKPEVIFLSRSNSIFMLLIIICILLTACSTNTPKGVIKNSSIFIEAEVEQVLVKNSIANVYSGISRDLQVVKVYKHNSIIDVIGCFNDWYIIVTDEGYIGCINKEEVIPYIQSKDVKINDKLEHSLSKEEQRMLDLINHERVKINLNPLVLDITLTQLARLKSQDLIKNQYFNHYSPTYGSPFEMMNKHNISFIFAGENLAGNTTVEGAHEALMKSAAHRQNILNPNFTHVGIGIEKGGPYKLMITQLFVGK
ncbi:uncharacterized protein, YkwD family [Alkaliphilus peptidifermentans DSM 18978]|uniref:Uncharacterized protein, YkwD family n=1 Tax=Alkaliphilus peptidifermentans DSM 18978 TaxID=1120976 RepID=A0A1G5HT98_9FIRM|nr:uncharacterized protein, YkwD family [Alkaliphilus peptidifermentans DSM 18978]